MLPTMIPVRNPKVKPATVPATNEMVNMAKVSSLRRYSSRLREP